MFTRKKDGGLRVVVNFQVLNKQTERMNTPNTSPSQTIGFFFLSMVEFACNNVWQ